MINKRLKTFYESINSNSFQYFCLNSDILRFNRVENDLYNYFNLVNNYITLSFNEILTLIMFARKNVRKKNVYLFLYLAFNRRVDYEILSEIYYDLMLNVNTKKSKRFMKKFKNENEYKLYMFKKYLVNAKSRNKLIYNEIISLFKN